MLLVGTGRFAGASLAALRDRGVTDVRVYSPSGRGTRFAASHGIEAVARGDYAATAAGVDIIVTCTTSEQHVVDRALIAVGREELAASVAVLPGAPAPEPAQVRQLVIDLGLPRNVAPDVVEVPGVELLDLETIKIHAPLEELGATDAARAIVGDEARASAPPQRSATSRPRSWPCASTSTTSSTPRSSAPGRVATTTARPSARCATWPACCCTPRWCARASSPGRASRPRGSTGSRRSSACGPTRPRRRCATGRRRMPPSAAPRAAQADAS